MSQDRPGNGEGVVPEAPTEGYGPGERPLVIGQALGDRYQIVGRLGAGGMGEVWQAFDVKLRVEVALKSLRVELAEDEARLELLRSEVRAAREVTSPNVCRIFDLVELNGHELVSMEYVDGTTLLEVLAGAGAAGSSREAQEIASQFLAGSGGDPSRQDLVHRDVKPENIMVTRTGRVVLMDFGLARSSEEGAGSGVRHPGVHGAGAGAGRSPWAPRADLFCRREWCWPRW